MFILWQMKMKEMIYPLWTGKTAMIVMIIFKLLLQLLIQLSKIKTNEYIL